MDFFTCGLAMAELLMDLWEGATLGPAKLRLSFISRLLCKLEGRPGCRAWWCWAFTPCLRRWGLPCSVLRCLQSLLLYFWRWAVRQAGVRIPLHHTRAAVSSWGELPSALELQKPGKSLQLAASWAPAVLTPVCVLVQCSIVIVPNKHWEMAHLCCCVYQ